MTPRDLPHSVHQRLLNQARTSDRTFNEMLHYYGLERFLYRLSRSEHASDFVLKGALSLSVWDAPFTRPTRDIDLLGHLNNSPDAIGRVFREVCQQEVEPDGVRFDPKTMEVRRITQRADYHGVRVTFRGYLGDARIPMQVDIGFGDALVGSEQNVDYPTILDMPAPRIRVYSRESTIAEKLEAMVTLGEINSRMRDFYDIWFLSRQCSFDGALLAEAITRTFETRNTTVPPQPTALTEAYAAREDKQTQWAAFIRKSTIEDAPADFTQVVTDLRDFLGPLVRALSQGNQFDGTWNPQGLWQ